MSKYIAHVLACIFMYTSALCQNIKSPAAFLGYESGEAFTFHTEVERYFRNLAMESNQVRFIPYGSSYEGKQLFVVAISNKNNIERLEEIRKSNLALSGLLSGKAIDNQPTIVWMSYNIHGNEAVSTEAAMRTAYELLAVPKFAAYLENTIVIIDPCLNPDGHTRYVQFYTERAGMHASVLPFTWEHQERWPGGRPNHYLFDLNRDWAWQTQKESRERVAILNQWMPHVHIDFHEQGIDAPYFFSPAAEPYHKEVTQWQRQFQHAVGKRLGKLFDENGWLYFTGEIFDLLYPSYGDTYPTFNGAIGMTFEQGGSGRAGLAVLTSEGDTLTLQQRIEHHHFAGIYTVETASKMQKKLVDEFKKYFDESIKNPQGKYKSYVIKQDNPDKIKALTRFMEQHDIRWGFAGKVQKAGTGFSFRNGKELAFDTDAKDIILSAYQPKSKLLQVLFEPNTVLSDSNTYDITAWALPYAWDLDAYATTLQLESKEGNPELQIPALPADSLVAAALLWQDLEDAHFLATALRIKAIPRINDKDITLDGQKIPRGSLLFLTRDIGEEKMNKLFQIAAFSQKKLISIHSSFPDEGPSFGSSSVRKMKIPEIGILSATPFMPYESGEFWHFFDENLEYPVHLLEPSQINSKNLTHLNVLFVGSFYSSDWLNEQVVADLKKWVAEGGRLILSESAVQIFSSKAGVGPKMKNQNPQDSSNTLQIVSMEEQNQSDLSRHNPGSIFKLHIDNSHPLAYGYRNELFMLKTNSRVFEPTANTYQIGIHTGQSLVSGFVGHQLKSHLSDGLSIGIESIGKGHIVWFADNPIFRSFWRSGKLMIANAAFMLP
jgi:hypothetical protein